MFRIAWMPEFGIASSVAGLPSPVLADMVRSSESILASVAGRRRGDTLAEWGWHYHRRALALYGFMAALNATKRSQVIDLDACRRLDAVESEMKELGFHTERPPWFGDKWIRESHRSWLNCYRGTNYPLCGLAPHSWIPVLWPQVLKNNEYRLRVSSKTAVRLDRGRKLPQGLTWDSNRREVLIA